MCMNIRYRVTLTSDERHELQALTSSGQGAVRRIKRAQILLAAAAQATDETIALTVGVGTSTVYRTKQRFVENGLDRALSEMPRPGAPRKLGAGDEALLVALACSHPPSGRARWTMELLADEVVRLTAHETLSGDTVARHPVLVVVEGFVRLNELAQYDIVGHGRDQIPRTSNPNVRAANPSAASCVAIVGSAPMRSRQIRAVAR